MVFVQVTHGVRFTDFPVLLWPSKFLLNFKLLLVD